MKRNLLKSYNALIAFLLAIIGIGSECSTDGMEYGVPSATFKVIGTVTDKENHALSEIRVVMMQDTGYTGTDGTYNMEIIAFPENQDFPIMFEDVDGSLNGTFLPKDTNVVFINPQYVHGDGSWYKGETTKELNVILKSGN